MTMPVILGHHKFGMKRNGLTEGGT